MDSRRLTPEILDHLPPDDPEAIRSRRDLFRVNRIMGNYRWIASRLSEANQVTEWVEIGSGDGHLCSTLSGKTIASLRITGVDFMPRPDRWPESWHWRQGDLFAFLEEYDSNSGNRAGLVANLFLHHFDAETLLRIGTLVQNQFTHLLFSEPCRRRLHLYQAMVAHPFVGKVTRHDMPVSIEAGFRKGELAAALGLDERQWHISEAETFLGAYRFEAVRASF